MVCGDWKLHEVIARARLSTISLTDQVGNRCILRMVPMVTEASHPIGIAKWKLLAPKALVKLVVRSILAVFTSERAHVHGRDAEPHEEEVEVRYQHGTPRPPGVVRPGVQRPSPLPAARLCCAR